MEGQKEQVQLLCSQSVHSEWARVEECGDSLKPSAGLSPWLHASFPGPGLQYPAVQDVMHDLMACSGTSPSTWSDLSAMHRPLFAAGSTQAASTRG
jgi:hypothetical protein